MASPLLVLRFPSPSLTAWQPGTKEMLGQQGNASETNWVRANRRRCNPLELYSILPPCRWARLICFRAVYTKMYGPFQLGPNLPARRRARVVSLNTTSLF